MEPGRQWKPKGLFPKPTGGREKGIDTVRRIFSQNKVYNIQMEHLVVFAGARKRQRYTSKRRRRY